MTDDEWDTIAGTLAEGFAGAFDEPKEDTYKTFLERFDFDDVMAALGRVMKSGKPYVPALPEIVEQLERGFDVDGAPPGWGEVYTVLWLGVATDVEPPPHCEVCDDTGLVLDEEENTSYPCSCRPARMAARAASRARPLLALPREQAVARADALHRWLGAWVVAGYDRLRMEAVNDDEYAGAVRHRLEQEWLDFCERAQRREAHGTPVTAATERRRLAPRHIGEIEGGARGELEAGGK